MPGFHLGLSEVAHFVQIVVTYRVLYYYNTHYKLESLKWPTLFFFKHHLIKIKRLLGNF